MYLTLVEGRSGSGKTAYCYGEIARRTKEGTPCFFIVPEQRTYEAELALMQVLGGGLMGVEVLSLPRLAQKVLRSAGGGTRTYLSGEGKRMALRKVISENKGKLALFGGAAEYGGLAEKLGRQIAMLKRGEIGPEQLRSGSEKLSDPLLTGKMKDLATVYEGMNAFMEGRYIDGEDQQALLIARIPEADFLENSCVYIDGFYGHQYTEQAYGIIAALLGRCTDVTVCLRTPLAQDEDADLFSGEIQARVRLLALAGELGLSQSEGDLQRIRLPQVDLAPQRSAPLAVKELERSLYAYRDPHSPLSTEGLSWYEAPSREDEVLQLAQAIDRLLRRGVRAREIAVAAGDLDVYAPLLRKALKPLPLYMDEKRPLASHGIVGLTLGALRCAEGGVTLGGLAAICASGLAPVADEDWEALENYALEYDLQYRGWQDEAQFDRGAERSPELYAAATRARDALLPPIQSLAKALRADKTAGGLCRALFAYYEALEVREALEAFCQSWEDAGEIEIAAECAQVWQLTLALLDQIALLMEGSMTIPRFIEVLEEGFKAQKIGLVPALTDQINLGEVERLADRDGIQHLFILGCTEGCVPKSADPGGMIDDEDIEKLEDVGISAFQHSRSASAYARQCVYALCARAERTLAVSWPRSDQEGNALFPSMAAERLRQLFPENQLPAPSLRSDKQPGPEPGFRQLVGALNQLADSGDPPKGASPAYGYFAAAPNWQNSLAEVDRRLFPAPLYLDGDAQPLFSRWRGESVTRLETFNQCPFRHFVQYGLRPAQRREWREERRDIGNYYHEALDTFTRRVMAEGGDWAGLTQEQIDVMLDEILEEITASHNLGILLESARGRAQARNLRESLTQTAWAMVEQIRAGEFTPLFSELEIGQSPTSEAIPSQSFPALSLTLSDGSTLQLKGKIDRVDRYQGKQGSYIRIVDYKSGSMDFSFDELYHGLKLQLPLYLLAAQSLGEPGGMFYLHIQSSSADEDALGEEGSQRDALQLSYRLNGILLGEPEVIQAMDQSLAPGEKSLYVPVKLKADGSTDAASSKVLPAQDMQLALHFAMDKAVETAERIRGGDTAIAPYKRGQRDACAYCDYRSICRFEPGRGDGYRKLKKVNQKSFFSALEGDDAAGESEAES